MSRRIIIYGAGEVGKKLLRLFLYIGIEPYGIAVTDMEGNPDCIGNIKVRLITDYIKENKDVIVALGVSNKYKGYILNVLGRYGFKNVYECDINELNYKKFKFLERKEFLALWYRQRTGMDLVWTDLKTYNEKIQYLKLFDDTVLRTRCADKILVRNYVRDRIGESHLVPIFGCWEHYDQINISNLPDSFIMKCNHGSHWNIIVKDKGNMNHEEIKQRFERWLSSDYSDIQGLEMQYHGIRPMIYAEELLVPDRENELYDYRFFMFNDELKIIFVDITPDTNYRRNIYTEEWKLLPYWFGYPTAPEVEIKKPICFDEMKKAAKDLAKGFKHVRIDFYVIHNRFYFGEMTFHHGSGIQDGSSELMEMMGKWISI